MELEEKKSEKKFKKSWNHFFRWKTKAKNTEGGQLPADYMALPMATRDIDYGQFVGPIYSQGVFGSCWIMSCLGLYHILRAQAGQPITEMLSVQFVADFCPNRIWDGVGYEEYLEFGIQWRKLLGRRYSTKGGDPEACLRFLETVGVPLASEYKGGLFYGDRFNRACKKDWKKGGWVKGDKRCYRVSGWVWRRITPSDFGKRMSAFNQCFRQCMIRKLLTLGPVLTCIRAKNLDDSCLTKDFVYSGEYLKGHTTHAVVVIGICFSKRLYKVLNSYGSNFGDGGIFYIRWDDDSGIGEEVGFASVK